MPLTPYRDPSEPLFEQLINEIKEGKQFTNESIEGAAVKKETLTPEKTTTGFYPKRIAWEGSVVIKAALAESISPQAYLLNANGGAPLGPSLAGVVKCGEVDPAILNLEPPGLEITGKSTKAELFVSLHVSKAPVASFTFGIYKITSIAETNAQFEPTVNTTAESTCLFTTPAGKAGVTKTGAAVALTKGANYMIGFTSSAATAAESLVVAKAQVWISNV